MFVKTLPLQWWSKKLKLLLVWVQEGEKHGFRGYFEVLNVFGCYKLYKRNRLGSTFMTLQWFRFALICSSKTFPYEQRSLIHQQIFRWKILFEYRTSEFYTRFQCGATHQNTCKLLYYKSLDRYCRVNPTWLGVVTRQSYVSKRGSALHVLVAAVVCLTFWLACVKFCQLFRFFHYGEKFVVVCEYHPS